MKRLLIVVLAAGLAGSAAAAEVYWASTLGGDAATWEDGNNWTVDLATPLGAAPGTTDNARIYGASWQAGWPSLSSAQNVAGVYMGLVPGDATVSFLNITATGSLTTNGDDGWNDGIQMGWYNDAVINSAGTVNTGTGWTDLGKGDAGNGYGNATLNLTGGSWTTPSLTYNNNSANHVQLDGGTMTTWGVSGLHEAGQTMDITDGTLLFHTTDVNWFPWIRDLGLTGYGSEDNANLIGSHDENTWTVTAIPEPATLGMLVLVGGGILFIRKRFMI